MTIAHWLPAMGDGNHRSPLRQLVPGAGQAFQPHGTITFLTGEEEATVRACKGLAALISQSEQVLAAV